MRETRAYIYRWAGCQMLFVLAAWACLFMTVLLAWLWVQSHPHRTRPALRHAAHADTHGLVFATAGWFSMLSIVLFTVHFAVPAQERQADAIWSQLGNLSLDEDSFNASISYTRI